MFQSTSMHNRRMKKKKKTSKLIRLQYTALLHFIRIWLIRFGFFFHRLQQQRSNQLDCLKRRHENEMYNAHGYASIRTEVYVTVQRTSYILYKIYMHTYFVYHFDLFSCIFNHSRCHRNHQFNGSDATYNHEAFFFFRSAVYVPHCTLCTYIKLHSKYYSH